MAVQTKVTKTEQVQSKDTTGTYVPALRTWFTVNNDGPFYVDVPVSSATPAAVQALIAAYAANIAGVQSLGSGS
jgi:hypothetical protein